MRIPVELAQAELQVEEGQAPKDQHGEVGDEEGPLKEHCHKMELI